VDKKLQKIFNFNLSFLAEPMTLVLIGILAGLFFLARGIGAASPVAFVILGGLIFIVVAGVGAAFVLGVQWVGDRREAARDKREQERFRDNTRENLVLMQQMANAQAAQARMLSAHQATLSKALPQPDVVEGDFVAFNPALLASIDEELGVEVERVATNQ
jgi:hypothetical protein